MNFRIVFWEETGLTIGLFIFDIGAKTSILVF